MEFECFWRQLSGCGRDPSTVSPRYLKLWHNKWQKPRMVCFVKQNKKPSTYFVTSVLCRTAYTGVALHTVESGEYFSVLCSWDIKHCGVEECLSLPDLSAVPVPLSGPAGLCHSGNKASGELLLFFTVCIWWWSWICSRGSKRWCNLLWWFSWECGVHAAHGQQTASVEWCQQSGEMGGQCCWEQLQNGQSLAVLAFCFGM